MTYFEPTCDCDPFFTSCICRGFAGVTADGKTPLWFVPQGVKVNSQNYLDLLKSELLPCASAHFRIRSWTFQQDGAEAHRARMVQGWCRDYLSDLISFQDWPANSPDLNLMDYTDWSVLEAKSCRKLHRSVDSLKEALQKAWDELYPPTCVPPSTSPRSASKPVDADGDIFEFQCSV